MGTHAQSAVQAAAHVKAACAALLLTAGPLSLAACWTNALAPQANEINVFVRGLPADSGIAFTAWVSDESGNRSSTPVHIGGRAAVFRNLGQGFKLSIWLTGVGATTHRCTDVKPADTLTVNTGQQLVDSVTFTVTCRSSVLVTVVSGLALGDLARITGDGQFVHSTNGTDSMFVKAHPFWIEASTADNVNRVQYGDPADVLVTPPSRGRLVVPLQFRVQSLLTVSPAVAVRRVGGMVPLAATVGDRFGNLVAIPVAWTVSDPTVARITPNAAGDSASVVAVATGTARITANVPGQAATSTLSVMTGPSCLANDLAWYPLNNSAADASGNGFHGTLVQTSAVFDRYSNPGGAIYFSGSSWIDLGDRFNTLQVPFSVAVWVKKYVPQNPQLRNQFRSILATDDSLDFYSGLWFQTEPAGNLSISYGDGGPTVPGRRRSLTSSAPLQDSVWTHVVATVGGPTDMSLYVNGVAVPGTLSGTGGNMVHVAAPARIGAFRLVSANLPWLGVMDDLRIYDCTLSATEVDALFRTP